jgi:hypothetical protein
MAMAVSVLDTRRTNLADIIVKYEFQRFNDGNNFFCCVSTERINILDGTEANNSICGWGN